MITVAMSGAGLVVAQATSVLREASAVIPGVASAKDFVEIGAFALLALVFVAGLRWGQKFVETYVADLIAAIRENTAATKKQAEDIDKRLDRTEVIAVQCAQVTTSGLSRIEKGLVLHEMTVAGVNPKADVSDPENLKTMKSKIEVYQEHLRRSDEYHERSFGEIVRAIGGNA